MTDDAYREAASKFPSCVSPPFDALIERIGFDPLFELAEEFGGGEIYIPTAHNMFRKCLAKAAVSEFDGYNHRALAKKYGFSVKSVRSFLKENDQ